MMRCRKSALVVVEWCLYILVRVNARAAACRRHVTRSTSTRSRHFQNTMRCASRPSLLRGPGCASRSTRVNVRANAAAPPSTERRFVVRVSVPFGCSVKVRARLFPRPRETAWFLSSLSARSLEAALTHATHPSAAAPGVRRGEGAGWLERERRARTHLV